MANATYFAVLVMTHVRPVPQDLEEPNGVFTSRAEAAEYLRDNCEDWMSQGGNWPFGSNIMINEYASRRQAERADVSDGFVSGNHISGAKPISSEMR